MEPTILFEDDMLVAVSKPSGMLTHPDGVSIGETVSDWFAKTYPNSRDVGEAQTLVHGTVIARPGVVHRLDRDTSGALLLAKTQEMHAFLKNAFQEHRIQKTYRAFIYGMPKQPEGVISFPIGRSRKDFRLRSAHPKAHGTLREAVTEYEVLADINTHAMLHVYPKTGRTHQIRVHLKAIHHPIVCDTLYAPSYPCELGLTRLGLHAEKLIFTHPNGEEIRVISSLPEDLAKAAARFS